MIDAIWCLLFVAAVGYSLLPLWLMLLDLIRRD